jgi:hypothetical protein
MRLRYAAYRRVRGMLTALALLPLGACTYEQEGPAELHYEFFKTGAPTDDTVTICSAYGCTHQTPFTFTADDIRQIAVIMDQARAEDTPEAERKALRQAIAWIERRVGAATGTDRDRPGLDFFGSGVKSQQDCVDEATNTTSYMLVMERYALLHHHKVVRPMAKGNLILGRWPHWGAMIEEKATGTKYAVDSFFYANGEPPVIMAALQWYIDEGEPARAPRSATSYADAQDPAMGPVDRGGLERLLARVLPPEPRPKASALGFAADKAR